MSRRSFLAGSAGAAALAFGLGACASGDAEGGGSPAGFARALGQLALLPATTVVTAADAGYKAARLPWNARYDDLLPAAIVSAGSAQAIAAAIGAAREYGVPFSVRNGRHSFGGYSTSSGMIIDVSPLNGVAVDASGERVTLGSGLTNLAMYEALAPTGKMVPGGTCPTVGITGLTSGGGIGRLASMYGLTCDSLLGATVVLADGTAVTADGSQNSDLFWALRGGGGGNFGVIADLTFQLRPADMAFTTWAWSFAWTDTAKLIAAWQDWILTLPDQAHADVILSTEDPADTELPVTVVSLTYAGQRAAGARLLADLVGAAGVKPTSKWSQHGSYLEDRRDAYCHGLRREECATADLTQTGQLSRPAMAASSDFALAPWSADGIAVVMEHLEIRQRNRVLTPEGFRYGLNSGSYLLEATGTVINSVPSAATAFVHRNSQYVAQYEAKWSPGAPENVRAENLDWLQSFYAATAPYRSGQAYQNYCDPSLQDWQSAYYGENLPRLSAVKTAVDPDNVFSFQQSIPQS